MYYYFYMQLFFFSKFLGNVLLEIMWLISYPPSSHISYFQENENQFSLGKLLQKKSSEVHNLRPNYVLPKVNCDF